MKDSCDSDTQRQIKITLNFGHLLRRLHYINNPFGVYTYLVSWTVLGERLKITLFSSVIKSCILVMKNIYVSFPVKTEVCLINC